ncbi:DNA ligase D [Caldibacillus lycopersici]|uniref:DNA ligase (ATP) n=1 Tax=Perspicuibacillus lycopersici TaxID=1325689 RepID=A0AAE3LT78_9BACI|nr:DNA ligase D [Perspicuibacillus lycopersici]MCU9613603.1 DNA ligase D [Perspicuibacillus lycopersici]
MKPMLPSLTFDIPLGEEWVYETKYDGFRAMLEIGDSIKMISRNGKNLLSQFPEANHFFLQWKDVLQEHLPIILDGELAVLVNPYKSAFSLIQTRGRLRAAKNIEQSMNNNRCTFLAFDLLMYQGKQITGKTFMERKMLLQSICKQLQFPLHPNSQDKTFIQFIPYHANFQTLWKMVKQYDGEGIIAKHKNSKWEDGKRTSLWLKYKNWKKVQCVITAYEKNNGFFHVAVFHSDELVPIGLFKNGMTKEEMSALLQVIRANAIKENDQFIYVSPTICLELNYLELYENALREPYFSKFLFSTHPSECTLDKMKGNDKNLPIEITHPDKPLWKKNPITKIDYIHYLKDIYPYIQPFLSNRNLTVIRYPHGTFGEAFFQKNCPDYAPDFVETNFEDGINYIVCNNIETYLWLGNQLAIEFHLPYRTVGKSHPKEIVIDLDPPTKNDFPLAVEAALFIKEDIIDKLGLEGFIKVSGNRGLQIYFPLAEDKPISWDEARLFTEFIANYIIAKNDKHFTIERLKKNRGNKLYIDYVQHAEGKTIISPFSLRGNENAGVAAPIFWEELADDKLTPDGFSMQSVLNRIKEKGNPFEKFFQAANSEQLQEVLQFLKKNHS